MSDDEMLAAAKPSRRQVAESYSREVADEVQNVYGFAVPWDLILSVVMALFEKLCAKTPEELAEAVAEAKNRKKRDKRLKQLRAAIRDSAKQAGTKFSASQVEDIADVMVQRASEKTVRAAMAAPE